MLIQVISTETSTMTIIHCEEWHIRSLVRSIVGTNTLGHCDDSILVVLSNKTLMTIHAIGLDKTTWRFAHDGRLVDLISILTHAPYWQSWFSLVMFVDSVTWDWVILGLGTIRNMVTCAKRVRLHGRKFVPSRSRVVNRVGVLTRRVLGMLWARLWSWFAIGIERIKINEFSFWRR